MELVPHSGRRTNDGYGSGWLECCRDGGVVVRPAMAKRSRAASVRSTSTVSQVARSLYATFSPVSSQNLAFTCQLTAFNALRERSLECLLPSARKRWIAKPRVRHSHPSVPPGKAHAGSLFTHRHLESVELVVPAPLFRV